MRKRLSIKKTYHKDIQGYWNDKPTTGNLLNFHLYKHHHLAMQKEIISQGRKSSRKITWSITLWLGMRGGCQQFFQNSQNFWIFTRFQCKRLGFKSNVQHSFNLNVAHFWQKTKFKEKQVWQLNDSFLPFLSQLQIVLRIKNPHHAVQEF